MLFRALTLTVAVALPAAAAPAQRNLELGKMWTFESPPLAYLEEEYGFVPSREWLDALRLASLRLGGGCSASFVSPKGLIMTNHHCVRDWIERVSPAGADWLRDGYYATRMRDEIELPGLSVRQLVSMRDVTEAINAGVAATADEAAAAARRANRESVLARARAEHPSLEPEVVELHQGARHQLYLYRVFRDVRLVCAPHLQVAHFGGDPDNFTYPRYSIDFAFCRAYEDGRPADTRAHHFRWSRTGPVEGELLFVTGNPGSTNRLKTQAQMEYLRDARYPMVRQMIDNRLAIMRELADEDEELERSLRPSRLTYENAKKAYAGYHEGLLDDDLMTAKMASEVEFRRRVQADPDLRARYGEVWDRLEEVAAARASFEPQRRFHSTAGSPHLGRAVELVRAVRAVDAEERAGHLAKAKATELSWSPFARAAFVDHLIRARDWLPATDPYLAAFVASRPPEQTAAALEASAVADEAYLERAVAAGELALRDSDDLAVRLAVALEPLLRSRRRVRSWLNEQESALGTEVGRALFAVYGDAVSPDATYSLRFSDGVAKGFEFNGTVAPFRTSFYGLFGRNAAFGNRAPFDLPAAWRRAVERIDLSRSVNFVSSNDIIGGNSGSPIVNRQLEVVGLVFDGNIEMLANRFVYRDDVPRAVSVHVDAIGIALTEVYGADRVMAELLGR